MTPLRFLALAALLAPLPAAASSDDAWAQFRLDVAAACEALVQGTGTIATEVNPFGSERYGVALVTVTPAPAADGTALPPDRMACIYDKAAKTAELTGPFTGASTQ